MSLRLILAALLATSLALLGSWWAGYFAGKASGAASCAEGQVARYRGLLDESGQQLNRAQQQSDALFKRLSRQAHDDERTTQELANALAETTADRAACRFAAGVMQQLDDARRRAAQATAGGLGTTLPATGDDGR